MCVHVNIGPVIDIPEVVTLRGPLLSVRYLPAKECGATVFGLDHMAKTGPSFPWSFFFYFLFILYVGPDKDKDIIILAHIKIREKKKKERNSSIFGCGRRMNVQGIGRRLQRLSAT